jgi:ADP-heptose:LPS heptosyltransferase
MQKVHKKTHVLCLRFSALGDVAIASVVLKAYARDNPEIHFTLAGPGLLAPLFEGIPNLSLLPVDRKQPLGKILRNLWQVRPTHVADLHSVIRTFLLRSALFLCGLPVVYLHKGRRSRRRLLRNPAGSPALMPIYERYARTLGKLGFTAPSLVPGNTISLERGPWKKVGIAPFARHRGKQWSTSRMRQVANLLAQEGTLVFLFGGGEEEIRQMTEWTRDNSHIRLATESGKGFDTELSVNKSLDVMISMDSANMHFASTLGIPVISIWGATHPKAGFYGWRQDPRWAVQLPLDCRPCSVFGSKPCRKETYECMENLTVEQFLSYVRSL